MKTARLSGRSLEGNILQLPNRIGNLGPMRFAQAAEQGEKWADIRDARQSDGLVENAYWGNRIALVFQWLE